MKSADAIQKQFQEEINSWKRTLTCLLQENAFLKIRLSEVIQLQNSDSDFLNSAELFQNRFLRKDEIITIMRQDVAELEKLLSNDLYDTILEKDVIQKQQKMRHELDNIEVNFNKLKFDFNSYLAENL